MGVDGALVDDLRAAGRLPEQTDSVYVVDSRNVLSGRVSLERLLLGGPTTPVGDAPDVGVVSFGPEADAAEAAQLRTSVSVLNGQVWGGAMGIGAVVLYGSLALGAVMTSGAAEPAGGRARRHRRAAAAAATRTRPAQGASVRLTFITDCMGFFLFLGLARVSGSEAQLAGGRHPFGAEPRIRASMLREGS